MSDIRNEALFASSLDEQLLTDYVAEREHQETLRSETEARRFWSSRCVDDA
jgi:hypothetical protein